MSVINSHIVHHFGADVYIREMLFPKGYRVQKHTHDYDHFSMLASGVVTVLADGVMTSYQAPALIKIEKGVSHEVLAITDTIWYCIHGTIGMDTVNDLDSVHIE